MGKTRAPSARDAWPGSGHAAHHALFRDSLLAASVSGAGSSISFGMLTQHSVQAMSELTPAQQVGISGAYRTALTGSFLLSAVVMTAAFLLVVGLPELRLRNQIEGAAAE